MTQHPQAWCDVDGMAWYLKSATGGKYGMEIIEGMIAGGIISRKPSEEEVLKQFRHYGYASKGARVEGLARAVLGAKGEKT